jgi:signal transduction histidine kinase
LGFTIFSFVRSIVGAARRYIQIGWPIMGLVALVGFAGFWVLSDIARDQDDAYQQATSDFVKKSVDDTVSGNTSLSIEYSVWDDAVENVLFDYNPDWLKTNFYAVGSSSLSIYRPSSGLQYLYIRPELEFLRGVLQTEIPRLARDRSLFWDSVLSAHAQTVPLKSLVVIDGRLAAISVQPLQPEKGSPLLSRLKQRETALVVGIKFFTSDTISSIAASYGLKHLKLHIGIPSVSTDRSRVHYPVTDLSNAQIASISWDHLRPGTAAFKRRVAPIIIALFLAGILAIAITHIIASANLSLLSKARAAEEASRAKSSFLANVSHELRTPLNTIIGYSEMIAEESAYDGQAQTASDARKVTTSAQHLLALINDLLDHSKIEAGKMDINPAQTDIAALLETICDTVKGQIAQNDNHLIVALEPDIGEGFLDAMRVKQCLLNLLSNAAKFTKQGTISLSAQATTINGQALLRLEVRDTGLGMSEATMDKLFQPFNQANETVAAQYGGTGLGLVITKALANAMGGKLSVQSALGIGTTFILLLPRTYIALDDSARSDMAPSIEPVT